MAVRILGCLVKMKKFKSQLSGRLFQKLTFVLVFALNSRVHSNILSLSSTKIVSIAFPSASLTLGACAVLSVSSSMIFYICFQIINGSNKPAD